MTRTLWIGTLAMVTGTALGVAAQPPRSADSSRSVVVTGCVERGTTSATAGTTGTTATTTPGPDTKYVLTNVAAEPKATGTTGAGQPGSISDARSYRLDDADQDKVASHVGERVEISGTVEEQAPPHVGSTGSTVPTGSTATADAIAPKIKVSALRVVAQDCARR